MCRYVHKMTKLKSKSTLKTQISKTLFLHELDDLAKKNSIFFGNIPNVWFKFSVVHPPLGYVREFTSIFLYFTTHGVIFTRQIER